MRDLGSLGGGEVGEQVSPWEEKLKSLREAGEVFEELEMFLYCNWKF